MSKKIIHTITKNKCLICEEKTDNGIILHKTRRQTHSLCLECSKGYLIPELKKNTNNIRQNIRTNMNLIKCPGTIYGCHRNMCKKYIDIRNIKFKKDSEINTYIFRILYTLDNKNCYICPNKNCGNIIEVNEFNFDTNTICQECNITWCRNCNISPYHKGMTCLEYDLVQNKSENSKYILKLREKGKLKFCPLCKTPTIKNEGCNKMVCVNCKIKWCWLCGEPNIDYDHYNINNNTTCGNKLWIQ